LPVEWSETSHIAWKTAIHDRGWSSPVVWKNQIWLTTASEDGKQMFAVCIDLATGKVVHDLKLWDVEKPSPIHNFNSYASCTPAIEEGRVYIHFGSYGTACLESATGKVVWQRNDLPCEHYRGPGSSPIIYHDLLIVHFDGFDFQYVAALNKRTGETVWKKERDIDWGTTDGDFMKAFATPSVIDVAGQPQLISPASKATIAYDPATGEELWRLRYQGFSTSSRPFFGKGLLFVNSGHSKASLYAIRPTGMGDITDSALIAWQVNRGIGTKPSSILVGDYVFNLTDSGTLNCLSVSSGKQLWTNRIGGEYSASLVCGDGKLYCFSEQGAARVVAPSDEYQQLAENHLDEGCLASPAIVGHALIVRTKTHLYRIENN
jgi:outer membrane protein assembly factor BamB